ncbi:MAG TPA: hypothetical protein VFM49_16160 [Chloroflexia bacterium]|jgi:hypothetical protein|nr:hypothetical protein [Chloroflexia bacterium]
MTARRAILAGALLLCLLLAGPPALAADPPTPSARIHQSTGVDAPARAPLAAPKATPTPAPTPTGGDGLSGGQLFLGAALVAIGVAGATFLLVLMRTLRKHPPPTS